MIRAFFAFLTFLTLSNTSFAAEPYSVHCTDAANQKMTLFFYPGESIRMIAAFAEDEQGWPMIVDFAPASLEEIGTLTLPEGFGMYTGVAPDESGSGIRRYMLFPLKLDYNNFTAYHGAHYTDEAIVLENKTQMNCF